MADQNTRIAELIFKYLRDDLTEIERQELEKWLNEIPRHRLFFENLTQEDNLLSGWKEFNSGEGDPERARLRFNAIMDARDAASARLTLRRRLSYAAAVIGFSFLGYVTFSTLSGHKSSPGELSNNLPSQMVLTGRGQTKFICLPDGTKAWLNASSSIRYPKPFTGSTRKVQIHGEAYLEVARNANQPFIAQVDDAEQVKVLGTSFNINAYKDGGEITTSLLDGSVVVSPESADKSRVLLPGEQAKVSANGQLSTTKIPEGENVIAWKDGLFQSTNEQIYSIMRRLARWHDLEIVFQITGSYRFTVPLMEIEDLQAILKYLQSAGRLLFIQKGKKITVVDKLINH